MKGSIKARVSNIKIRVPFGTLEILGYLGNTTMSQSTSNKTKVAAAYIRVSTDDQVELSPESQLEVIRKYAGENGYLLVDNYIFADEGISGRTAAKRPGFNHMIAAAKEKPTPFKTILL